MKVLTAVFLLAVMLGCNIEVDAGSFNLSGFLDPGFTFGRNRHRQQKREISLPNPFEVDLNETGSDDNERRQVPKHGLWQAPKHGSLQAPKHKRLQAPKHGLWQAPKHGSLQAPKHERLQAPKHGRE